jgi:hypothetical protein
MGKLLRFPTNRIVFSTLKAPELTEEESQLIKEEKFIEQITNQLTMDIIGVFQDNVVDMQNDNFLKDVAVIVEGIKSLMKRDFDRKHPMHDITDNLIKIHTLKDGRKLTDINYSKISVRKFKDPQPKKPEAEFKIEFEPDIKLD